MHQQFKFFRGEVAHAAGRFPSDGRHRNRPRPFDTAGAEIHYREALALAEPRGMRPLVAHCHFGLATLYRRIDKRQQSEEHLRCAIAMYCDMGMTYWLEKAEAELRESR